MAINLAFLKPVCSVYSAYVHECAEHNCFMLHWAFAFATVNGQLTESSNGASVGTS